MEKNKVLIIPEFQLEGEGLSALLQDVDWIELLGPNTLGHLEALKRYQEDNVNIILIDANFRDNEALDRFKALASIFPQSKQFVIGNGQNFSNISRLMRAGVSGYLSKASCKENLVYALEQVASDRLYFPEEISERILQDFIHSSNPGPRVREAGAENDPVDNLDSLTQRERSILRLMADGFSSSQIAEKLFISQFTVKTHRKHILKKLGCHNTPSLIKQLNEAGMIF